MSDLKKIVLDGVEYVRVDSLPGGYPPQDAAVVLVRTRASGVHVGEIVGENVLLGESRLLKNAHRVWRWRGANTLNELSQKGADRVWSRISEPVPLIELTDVIEVIPCSREAAVNLRTPRWPA